MRNILHVSIIIIVLYLLYILYNNHRANTINRTVLYSGSSFSFDWYGNSQGKRKTNWTYWFNFLWRIHQWRRSSFYIYCQFYDAGTTFLKCHSLFYTTRPNFFLTKKHHLLLLYAVNFSKGKLSLYCVCVCVCVYVFY